MKMKNKKRIQKAKRQAIREERKKKKKDSLLLREEEEKNTTLPTILIVCEGENTEPSYFNQFEITSATVKAIGEGYNTISLVTQAYNLQQKAISNNKPYDQVWCVFDKDDYEAEQFEQAIELAEQYEFGIAYSNQAFEYWLFLHFNNHQGGGMDRKNCCEELNKLLVEFDCKYDYKKTKVVTPLLFDLLLAKDPKDIKKRTRQELAITRAQKILQFHEENHTHPAQAESSTTVFHLVQELQKYL